MEPTIPQEPQPQQEIPAHVQRMMSEAYELKDRFGKLSAFIDKTTQGAELPEGMTGDDFDLLTNQREHMFHYLKTLQERLERAGISMKYVQDLGDFKANYQEPIVSPMTTNDEAGKYVAQEPTLPVSGRLHAMAEELVENPSIQGRVKILAAELRAANL